MYSKSFVFVHFFDKYFFMYVNRIDFRLDLEVIDVESFSS